MNNYVTATDLSIKLKEYKLELSLMKENLKIATDFQENVIKKAYQQPQAEYYGDSIDAVYDLSTALMPLIHFYRLKIRELEFDIYNTTNRLESLDISKKTPEQELV